MWLNISQDRSSAARPQSKVWLSTAAALYQRTTRPCCSLGLSESCSAARNVPTLPHITWEVLLQKKVCTQHALAGSLAALVCAEVLRMQWGVHLALLGFSR